MPATFERTQVGRREDLADAINNIDAKDYPLHSAMPKGQKLVRTRFDWQVDAYDAPNTDGVVDGADVSTYEDAAENRAILYGQVQKVRRTPMVTEMAEDVSDVAGVTSEMANAIKKKTIECKRDVEAVLGSDNESQTDNGSVPYKTRGLGKWIQATAQSHLPVDADFRTPSASIDTTALASLTREVVNNVMKSQYSQTGKRMTSMLVCGTSLKARFTAMVGYQPTVSNFTAILRSQRGSETAYQDNIESFTGDFGTYDLVLSNWLNWNNSTKTADPRRGYALDMSMLELRMNKNWQYKPLPDLDGGPRGVIKAIFGLMVKNPLGLAKFAATADS
jgi:hypothetical protein